MRDERKKEPRVNPKFLTCASWRTELLFTKMKKTTEKHI